MGESGWDDMMTWRSGRRVMGIWPGGLGQFQAGAGLLLRARPCLAFFFYSNLFQFFNYFPNVFKLENTKHNLTEVKKIPNLSWLHTIPKRTNFFFG
jgi:hypothetical protein